jgi:hemoglobin-like flavoprotein
VRVRKHQLIWPRIARRISWPMKRLRLLARPIASWFARRGESCSNRVTLKSVASSWWSSKGKRRKVKRSIINLNLFGFLRIFTENPEIKHLWKFSVGLKSEEEMRESAQLRSHGNNVFESVNAAVNCLDKMDALETSLVELGTRHVSYGAKIVHFPVKKKRKNIIYIKMIHLMQAFFRQTLSLSILDYYKSLSRDNGSGAWR